MARSPVVDRLDRKLYPVKPDPYRDRLRALAQTPHRQVLVFGCGRGYSEPDLRAAGRQVVGVDVTDELRDNPVLDVRVLYDGYRLPFPDGTFDLCCASWVLEHLVDPAATVRELARVLASGGSFVFRTPNFWFYAYLISRLVPNCLHPLVVQIATGRQARDTFPTLYRVNTRRSLRRILGSTGFEEVDMLVYLSGAHYLAFSLPTYLAGVAYERVVNATPLLEDLRGIIVGHFRKSR